MQLDGNVNRLLSRVLALHANPKAKATLDILWAGASKMVDINGGCTCVISDTEDHISSAAQSSYSAGSSVSGLQTPQYPGDVNQALIELGSTVCKVREPDCGSCPIQPWCSAFTRSAAADGHAVTYSVMGAFNSVDIPQPAVIDIEDTCRLCEPVASFEGVTSYPMKVDRKKAREELDIVNVLEWRSRIDPRDRQFLLVRRPEGGTSIRTRHCEC